MRSDRLQLLALLGLQHIGVHDLERLCDRCNAAVGLARTQNGWPCTQIRTQNALKKLRKAITARKQPIPKT